LGKKLVKKASKSVKKAVKKAAKAINWKKIKWGSLERWLKRHEKEIKRTLGKSPFTKSGEINDNVLRSLKANEELLRKLAGTHWKKIKKKITFKLNVLKG